MAAPVGIWLDRIVEVVMGARVRVIVRVIVGALVIVEVNSMAVVGVSTDADKFVGFSVEVVSTV